MLNTITTTILNLSGPPLVPLNVVDTYSMGITNKMSFQTYSKLNATLIPFQTLYQPHTKLNIEPTASLPLSSSVPTVNPMNRLPANSENSTVHFVAMNRSVKTFDGLDH